MTEKVTACALVDRLRDMAQAQGVARMYRLTPGGWREREMGEYLYQWFPVCPDPGVRSGRERLGE